MEKIDHIAIVVTNINHAVKWYTDNHDCKVNYKDNSWAELQFDNIKLALVLPQDHPPHIAFVDESIENGTKHRDGSESIYEHDTFGNIIEKIKYEKPKSWRTSNINTNRYSYWYWYRLCSESIFRHLLFITKFIKKGLTHTGFIS